VRAPVGRAPQAGRQAPAAGHGRPARRRPDRRNPLHRRARPADRHRRHCRHSQENR
jgi:hypothetical protein